MVSTDSTSPIRVLHVDDDHVMRLMTKTALARSPISFEVESCASGKELLEKFEEFSPDILLIDMLMPILDGITLTRKIRLLPNDLGKAVPVVFIAGKDNVLIDDRSSIEPILGVIVKPFSPTQLGQDLYSFLESFRENQ